jgi:hemoglobin-like flavoprotein
MTQAQIDLVQQSWSQVLPVARQSGARFYEILFDRAPSVKHLFKTDIEEQANKLMTILGYVVSKLNQLETLIPQVQQLGVRHNQYGATPVHYEVVGECLLQTLEEKLQDQWTPEVKDAWITAYNALKNVMIVAQEESRMESMSGAR